MKAVKFHFFLPFIFLVSNLFTAGAQNVSINTTGNANYTGAILDLSNNNINGSVGFLPPYVTLTNATVLNNPIIGGIGGQLSGLLVYNTSPSLLNGLSGPGLYYWNNTLPTPAWVYIGPSGITGNGTINYLARWLTATTLGIGVAQDNGLGVGISAAPIVPKSLLDVNGNVSVGAYAGVNAAPANGAIVSGQMGVGNSAPNGKAILDLTNAANNFGLMLPTMTTAQMPVITPAQDGLVIFNTTIGCPLYALGGVWNIMGGGPLHGNITFSYTGYIQSWVVPPCVTSITISAKGGAGGGAGSTGGNGAVVPAMAFNVTPGHVIMIIAGEQGLNVWGFGAGGGGASFAWDPATPANPLIVAGGGGGGASASNGLNAGTTTAATASANTGAGGVGGGAGAVGAGVASGGAGAGWNTAAAVPAALALHLGQGGLGQPLGFTGGSGATNQNETGGLGGFGGGGGGGSANALANYGGGGGGGGYNGGGSGKGTNALAGEFGGGGGGSGYFNGAIFTNAPGTTSTNAGNGSITITW